ncbi:MAG: hypothetical protein LBI68_00090 [Azoarcus sp.]|jgi:hypothetical protein|nr:hypothetical protein [Azoarcus sp.]
MKFGVMHIARADEDDLKESLNLLKFLVSPEKSLSSFNVNDDIWPEFHSGDCAHAMAFTEKILSFDAACISRVIWGYYAIANPKSAIIDPDCEYLELHPRLRELLGDPEISNENNS